MLEPRSPTSVERPFTGSNPALIFCNTADPRSGFSPATPGVPAIMIYSSPWSLASMTKRGFEPNVLAGFALP